MRMREEQSEQFDCLAKTHLLSEDAAASVSALRFSCQRRQWGFAQTTSKLAREQNQQEAPTARTNLVEEN